MSFKKSGFTLLELIIVIVIIGILATLGFTQYSLVLEKGRSSEARGILGTIRTAEQAYEMEYGTYPPSLSLSALSVSVPTSCDTNHYYIYSMCCNPPSGGRCNTELGLYAYRCTSGGKTPNYTTQYAVVICATSGRIMSDAPY